MTCRTVLLCGCTLLMVVGASHAWEVRAVHPFVEATADELVAQAPTLPVPDAVRLDASQNDWVHAAVLITAAPDEVATVRVALTGEQGLMNHVTLRPVGFVNYRRGNPPTREWSLDVIFNRPEEDFAPEQVQRIKTHVRNLENLAGYPRVVVTPQDPVMLWFTADTRNLGPGLYPGMLKVSGEDGATASLPVRLTVRPIVLPERNPLRTIGWQWIPAMPTKVDGARFLLDYGVNVTWAWWGGDDEPCREAGWDFFLYTFEPAWSGKMPEEFGDEAAQAVVRTLQERVARLGLAQDQWALCLRDEPNDQEAPRQAAWCQWLRQHWPEALIWCNVPWGPGPTNEWVSVGGLIRTLQPYVDIWCPYSNNLWDEHSGAMMPALRERSREVWYYEIMDTQYARNPSVGRGLHRALGWVAWRYRLQGCGWYSLNAYSEWPWAEDVAGKEYSVMYYTMPTRALEALRQGLVEYKRLLTLKELGTPEEVTDGFCDRLFAAGSPEDLDAVRSDMYDALERAATQ